jgi:hypothetical protein
LVLLIGGSAFGIVASLTDLDDETAVAILLLFAVASLATDIVFDFGKGWGLSSGSCQVRTSRLRRPAS